MHSRTKTTTEMAAKIVAAYVGRQGLPPAKLPELIRAVHGTIAGLAAGGKGAAAVAMPAVAPAVPRAKSVARGHVTCLEDGLRFKSLKRHLRSAHGLSPAEYRAKWGLPANHPIVAPSYSARRAAIAKEIRFGRKDGAEPKAPKAGRGERLKQAA